MNPYKEPFVVPRTLNEVSNLELETAWWDALTKDRCGDIDCNVAELRSSLIKLLTAKDV